MTEFSEEATQEWAKTYLKSRFSNEMFHCNSAAWFTSSVATPSQHFSPIDGVRAFKRFTGNSGSVLGDYNSKSVIIFYSAHGSACFHFHGQKREKLTPGTMRILCTGTCNVDGVTYNVTVTPYYVHLTDDLTLPAGAAGPELARQLLGISGLDRVTLKDLMVESDRIKLNSKSKNPREQVVCAAGKALLADPSWDNVQTFVAALKAWLPPSVSLMQCLRARRSVVAAPVLGHNGVTPARHPSTVIPLLARLLTNHYCESWNDPEAGWARAAVALLPASLRPGSGGDADEAGCLKTIKAMLVACERGVIGTREQRLRQATEHLTTGLSPESGCSTPGVVDAALEFTEPNPPTPLPPSEAFLWAHLVFCVMHCTASLSDLASHPLLASPKERHETLFNVGRHVQDDAKARVIAHMVLKALWPSGELAEPLTPKVGKSYTSLTRIHGRYPHSVPFLLARDYTSKARYNTDERSEELTIELYGEDMEATPEKLLAYFGRHFPALELAAWLVQAGGLCGASDERLGCTAQATLAGLGCTESALAAELKILQSEQQRKAVDAKLEAEVVAQIIYDEYDTDTITRRLIELPNSSFEHYAAIQMIRAEPWVRLLIGTSSTLPSDIANTLRINIQLAVTRCAASLGLRENMFMDGEKYVPVERLPKKQQKKQRQGSIETVIAEYQLLRLALNLCDMTREQRFQVVDHWVTKVKPVIPDVLEDLASHKPEPEPETQLQAMQSLGRSMTAVLEQSGLCKFLKSALIVAGPPGAQALAKLAARLLDYDVEL